MRRMSLQNRKRKCPLTREMGGQGGARRDFDTKTKHCAVGRLLFGWTSFADRERSYILSRAVMLSSSASALPRSKYLRKFSLGRKMLDMARQECVCRLTARLQGLSFRGPSAVFSSATPKTSWKKTMRLVGRLRRPDEPKLNVEANRKKSTLVGRSIDLSHPFCNTGEVGDVLRNAASDAWASSERGQFSSKWGQ